MGFRVLVVGGTGQVGSGLVRALLAVSSCTEVVMVNRRTIPLAADARLRQVIMDTSAANFASEIAELARTCSAQGEPLYAASCIGIGKGSQQWSEEDIKKLEIGLVGAFARGCLAAGIERFGLLSAAGSSAKSWIRYARIMGEKEDAVRSLGFKRLAIFRPGIIAGNAHTPGFLALLGRFVPGSFGTIDQDDIGRAFVGEFLHGQEGTTILENAAMKQRSRAHYRRISHSPVAPLHHSRCAGPFSIQRATCDAFSWLAPALRRRTLVERFMSHVGTFGTYQRIQRISA